MRAATVAQQLCKSCRTCSMFYCMVYFTCDCSFTDTRLWVDEVCRDMRTDSHLQSRCSMRGSNNTHRWIRVHTNSFYHVSSKRWQRNAFCNVHYTAMRRNSTVASRRQCVSGIKCRHCVAMHSSIILAGTRERKKTDNVGMKEQEQQRVAVWPVNTHCICTRQVSLRAAIAGSVLCHAAAVAPTATAALLLLLL